MHTGAAPIADITLTAQGSPRLPLALLQTLHKENASLSDTETTGLNRTRHAITEFASMRVDRESSHPSGQPYRLKLYNRFFLPMKPAYQDYLEAKSRGENPAYDRARYEYEIDLRALDVTGTRFIRPHADGPITGMEVNGKAVPAKPFYETCDELMQFIRPSDMYYNAPFDKPMLAEKICDAHVWRMLRQNEHLALAGLDLGEQAGLRFEDMTAEERDLVAERLKPIVPLPQDMVNSGQWKCVLHHYLLSEGQGPSNRLDDAYRRLVDASYTERAEHSAVEDITMQAKVAGTLHTRLGSFPTMAKVYEAILKKADPGCHVEVMPLRPHSREGKQPVEGDLRITFSKPPAQLSPRAQAYWHFFTGLKEAHLRNEFVPPHILAHDATQATVTLSAERSQPMSIGLLRKFMFYEEMLNSGLFEDMHFFDSTGNKVDVIAAGKGTAAERTVEDIPLGSLRKNLPYLRKHPALLLENLHVIRALRLQDRRVGLVIFEEGKAGEGDTVTIKGHQRAFGDVIFTLPPGKRPAECLDEVVHNLGFLIRVGAIPEMQQASAQSTTEDDELPDDDTISPDGPPPLRTRIRLDQPDRIRLTVSPKLLTLIARKRGRHTPLPDSAAALQPIMGPLRITKNTDESFTLEGHKLDFKEAFALPEGLAEGKADIAPPMENTLRDASWLLYRLARIPGTHTSQLKDGKMLLSQDDGLSLGAIQVLAQAGVPCELRQNHIIIDTDVLMQDAFHCSLQIGRAMESYKANQDKPIHLRASPAQAHVELHRALLRSEVTQADIDALGRIWLTDGKTWPDGRPRRYQFDQQGKPRITHNGSNGLSLVKSTLVGPFRHKTEEEGAMLAIHGQRSFLNALRLSLGNMPGVEMEDEGPFQSSLRVPAAHAAQLAKKMPEVAGVFHALTYAHGASRQAASRLDIDEVGKADLHAPLIPMLDDHTYLSDLAHLHTAITDSARANHMEKLRTHFPAPDVYDRRRSDITALTQMLVESEKLANDAEKGAVGLLAHIESSGYNRRVPKEIGGANMLLHEMQVRGQHSPAADAVATQLGRAHTALLRLDEAARMVQHAIGPSRGNALRTVLADAMLFHVDRLMESAVQQPSITAAIMAYEAELKRLIKQKKPNWTERDVNRALATAYQEKALSYLLRMAEHPEWAALTERLLERANPEHSVEQIRAVISLYQHASEPGWMDGAQATLAAWFHDLPAAQIARMVDECRLHKEPAYQEQARRQQVRDMDEEIDWRIARACERRARYYLYLLSDHPEYEAAARDLLARAGLEDGAIDRRIRTARSRQYSAANRERATTAMASAAQDDSLDTCLAHIEESPAMETRARQLLREELLAEFDVQLQRIGALRPDHYAELKLRRRIIRAVTSVIDEITDYQRVQFHTAQDVATAMNLLATEEEQRKRLHALPTGETPTVGTALPAKPERFGLPAGTVPTVLRQREELQLEWAKHAQHTLATYGVTGITRQDNVVHFDARSLFAAPEKWLAQLHSLKPTSPPVVPTPPTVPPIPLPVAGDIAGGLMALALATATLQKSDPGFDVTLTLDVAAQPSDPLMQTILKRAATHPKARLEPRTHGRVQLQIPASYMAGLLETAPTVRREPNPGNLTDETRTIFDIMRDPTQAPASHQEKLLEARLEAARRKRG